MEASQVLETLTGSPSNRNGKGTDVDAAVGQLIVQKNRGEMKVKCHEEKGMTFIYLILPVERKETLQFLPPKTASGMAQLDGSERSHRCQRVERPPSQGTKG